MILDLLANISFLLSSLCIVSWLSKEQMMSMQATTRDKLVYGLLFGAVGLFMIGMHVSYMDRHAPVAVAQIAVALSSLYGGPLSALSSAMLQGVAIITFFYPMSWEEALYFIGYALVGILGAIILKKPKHRWLGATVALIIFQLIAAESFPTHFVSELTMALAYAVMLTVGFVFMVRMCHAAAVHKKLELFAGTDPLTGLDNYRGLHAELERITIHSKERMLLILTDCEEVRLLNAKHGYNSVNEQFVLTGNSLRKLYPEAQVISRYDGDKFCVVTKAVHLERELATMRKVFEEELPARTNLTFKYVYVVYPDEALDPPSWLATAEERLFKLKEAYWLRREESTLWTEKMKVIGEMAAGMAHEIRNPLTAVKGFLQMAYRTKQFDKWYPTLMHEIDRMNELTVEFLSFSKPAQSNAKVEQLESCVERVYHLIESEALSSGHLIQIQLPSEPLEVWMDSDKMLQVLLNIMKNGLEAMPISGQLKVSVYADTEIGAEGQAKAGWAVVEIADQGTGIPEEGLKKIFDPFYTTKERGTGLGLAICMNIVKQHGGSIEVNSRVGEGTTFLVRLPLLAADDQRRMGAASGEYAI